METSTSMWIPHETRLQSDNRVSWPCLESSAARGPQLSTEKILVQPVNGTRSISRTSLRLSARIYGQTRCNLDLDHSSSNLPVCQVRSALENTSSAG
jgi:hypothetical protein